MSYHSPMTEDVSTWQRWCDNCDKAVSLVMVNHDPGVDEEWRQFREGDTVAFCAECHEYLGGYTWTT